MTLLKIYVTVTFPRKEFVWTKEGPILSIIFKGFFLFAFLFNPHIFEIPNQRHKPRNSWAWLFKYYKKL